jgi:hypothetical protein
MERFLLFSSTSRKLSLTRHWLLMKVIMFGSESTPQFFPMCAMVAVPRAW